MTELPLVVGAVIVDRIAHPSRVLAARRTRPPSLAGQWEFPGGKVEAGESPADALEREIAEELSVRIELHHELRPPQGETWPASNGYRMRLFFATVDQGELVARDGHDAFRWLGRDELEHVAWLKSDLDALPLIRAQMLADG